jgi:hypothetical protein
VLTGISGPKRDEVRGDRRKLHSGEVHSLHCSPNVVTTIRSIRMRWAEHGDRMCYVRNAYNIMVEIPER